MNASVIILAGGQSRRMGTNKALLSFDGKSVIQLLINRFSHDFQDIIVVTNEPHLYTTFPNVTVTTDEYYREGPLAGIHAGLLLSCNEKNVVIACDMPFATPQLAYNMLLSCDSYDAVIPKLDERIHPLFACYRKSTSHIIETQLQHGKRKMMEFLQLLNVIYMDETDLKIEKELLQKNLFNMNDQKAYNEAIQMYEQN
ncbi:molybdenum cofactor guanylyltransferase [Bacillus sp. HMF5848]|uniref:molybdenum cofactor guanylyltransferase n=1 Tax=Bacillus sp. HMF5848 TaxID=2495421 RepID=UPI000F792EDF|nr:molybdenum cofactor guanylyltransferase [Bacillus sp. HMF5848]RSK27950.1 molybdenum cofactor guanylyltransferase [Bacillus sp. HMF5848]